MVRASPGPERARVQGVLVWTAQGRTSELGAGAELDTALPSAWGELSSHGGCLEAGQATGQKGLVDAADQLGCLAGEGLEGAVGQLETGGRGPVRLEAVPVENGGGQGQRSFST